MKNLYKISLLFVLGLFFISCEEEEDLTNNILKSERYVYFSASNPGSVGEAAVISTAADGQQEASNRQARIEIVRTGTDVSSALDVTVDVTSSYRSTSDFHNEGDPADDAFQLDYDEVVTIPAGKTSTSFVVTTVNDDLSSGDKLLNFSIQSVSDASYTIGFPGEEVSLTSQAVVINDDDCPIDLSLFEGVFSITDVAPDENTANAGYSFKEDGNWYTGTIVFTVDPNDPTGTTGLLTMEEGNEGAYPFVANPPYVLKFNTCSGTISFDPLVTGDTYAIFESDENPATYSEDGSSFTLNGRLGDAGGSSGIYGVWNFTLTKISE